MKKSPPDMSSNEWIPPSTPPSTPTPPSTRATPPSPGRSTWKSWQVAVITVAAVAFMMGGAGMMMSGGPNTPAAGAGTVAHVTTEIRETRIAVGPLPSSAPKWYRTPHSGWASDGSRTISFELDAENDVAVWMKHVRPTLVVRCLGRQTEVYVVTDTASSLEPMPDKHTVRVAFDDQAETVEHWLDSADHKELFSPDGPAMARRIADADKMRFGFTPFNSSSVSAEFDVRGFAERLETITRTCNRQSTKPRAQTKGQKAELSTKK
jgi:hypothetical protein